MKGGLIMTRNQIEYWNLQENKRNNVARLAEDNRHALVSENETAKHNRASEIQAINELGETSRHNRATESAAINQMAEQHRHNVADEGIRSQTNTINQLSQQETARANRANEALKHQSNLLTGQQIMANYDVGLKQATARQDAAQAALNNAKTNLYKYVDESNYRSEQREKMKAEVNKILADTSLTDAQREKALKEALLVDARTASEIIDIVSNISDLASKLIK